MPKRPGHQTGSDASGLSHRGVNGDGLIVARTCPENTLRIAGASPGTESESLIVGEGETGSPAESEIPATGLHEVPDGLLSVSYSEFNDKYNQRDVEARQNMRDLIDSDANTVTNVFSTLL